MVRTQGRWQGPERPWGGWLDGMNEDGLVASQTFGGRPAQGQGFSLILILRYVLETCRTVDEAIAALIRIPIAQSHNVTLLDRSGAHATLFLGPDRAPAVTAELLCTNHQERVVVARTWRHEPHGRAARCSRVPARRARHDAGPIGRKRSSRSRSIRTGWAPPLSTRQSTAQPRDWLTIFGPENAGDRASTGSNR